MMKLRPQIQASSSGLRNEYLSPLRHSELKLCIVGIAPKLMVLMILGMFLQEEPVPDSSHAINKNENMNYSKNLIKEIMYHFYIFI